MPSLGRTRNRYAVFIADSVKRDDAITVAGHGGSIPADEPPISQGTAAAANTGVYTGIGLGVGCAVLIGLIVVALLIIRKRKEHNRMIRAIGFQTNLQSAQTQHVQEMPRPLSMMRCDTLVQFQERAGWNALSSDESVNESETVRRAERRKRTSVSLPKRLKRHGIPLKRLKRLTAILESPRSRNSPSVPVVDPMPLSEDLGLSTAQQPAKRVYNLTNSDEDDVFVCPGSPKPEVLPSFAIRSPGRYGAGIANNDNTRTYRSRSLDFMPAIPNDAIFGCSSRMVRLPMHARSFSLGAPPCRPPSGPVPPLPVIKPHTTDCQSVARRGVCVSRMSSSSTGSTSSSGLIATPILIIPEENQPIESPSLEDVVAQDDNASLKKVATNQWQNPLVAGPRQVTSAPAKQSFGGLKNHTSICGNIGRYSAESMVSNRMSLPSVESSDSLQEQLSLTQVVLPNLINVSGVSSENSLQGYRSARKTTPRKAFRNSVSESGSPLERHRTGVLRDISGNSNALSRQPSNATENSSRSSNGNPFQWDQPLAKPSAMKGSPNARKGHRRQNCVRISTLTPQILGPPPSRSTSPSIMHGIEEEPDSDEAAQQGGVKFVTNQRLSRLSSTSSFNPAVRPRASLTPSSPTLSVWTALQEHGLPSQASDSQLSGSVVTRSASRQSFCSSIHTIPPFPSPVKPAMSTTQLSQPIPEFYLSRPSTDMDEDEDTSPFTLTLGSGSDMSSSPPVVATNSVEYDPTHPSWPITTMPVPDSKEYDPASPTWEEGQLESSSAFFPFAAQNVDEQVSPRSRPASYGGDLPDTPPVSPPVSPKTMPEGFQVFFDKKETGSRPARALEKLTSANASAFMAQMSPRVDFPGASVLPPPEEDQAYAAITTKSMDNLSRKATHAAYSIRTGLPPQPPSPSKANCVPSPLHISGKTVPTGPRSQPAHSVLKNAMVLRRMNSEVNNIVDRESRRFVRLGREASPLLPWIGSTDPNESCAEMNELFDFDFAADSKSGADEQNVWDMEEVDISAVERTFDGLLTGPENIANTERSRENGSPSVWNDGEKYWEQGRSTPIGLATSSPRALQGTPREQIFDNSRSIQNTPKSLYDSDGFLKS